MDKLTCFPLVLLTLSYSSAFIADHLSTHQPVPPVSQNVCQLPENQRVPVSGGCDFNNGTCGYEFPAELWRQHTEQSGAIMFGKIDNTSGIEQKFALFLTTDGQIQLNTSSTIMTRTIYEKTICLNVWYLMPNQNSVLKVYLTEGVKPPQLVWETHHQLSSQWKMVEIPIQVNSPFLVSFTSTKENNFGYVGLDSISFYTEKRPTTTSTTTASTTTEQITTITSIMQVLMNATFSSVTVPTVTSAVTSNKSSSFMTSDDRFVTTIPTRSMSTAQTTIDLNKAIDATTESQKTQCQCNCPTAPTANNCQTTTSSINVPTKIETVTTPQACNINAVKQPNLPGNCDFNKDTCGYTVPSYPHLWELTSYRYIYGGPDVGEITGDHSVDGTGGYMVFNTNNKHVQNGAASEISSPPTFTNNTSCLEFWYIIPKKMAKLEVYIAEENGTKTLVWTLTGPTNGWHRANIHISFIGKFQVMFSSKKIASDGFLGIDDIILSHDYNSSTNDASFTKTPSLNQHSHQTINEGNSSCKCTCPTTSLAQGCLDHQPTADPVCNSKKVMTNASCNFDKGSCGYTVPMYPHLWEITRYYYGDDKIGIIKGDHTTSDERGMYAVFSTDNTNVQVGARGEMISNLMPANHSICITFWYNMPTDKSVLEVYKRHTDTTKQDQLVWQQTHVKTMNWKEASVVLQSNENFQIVFASTKTGLQGYFGVDDIVVHYV